MTDVDETGGVDWDAAFQDAVQKMAERAVEDGFEPEEAHSVAVTRAREHLLDTVSPGIAASLLERGPEMLAEHHVLAAEFEGRLHERWGRALDLYYMVLVGTEELGAEAFRDANRHAVSDDEINLVTALGLLHSRACRTALEVHTLLAGGFPRGAHARSRTIYELAVVARVLAVQGARPEHADIGSRYLAFRDLTLNLDANELQGRADELGIEPFSDEELAEIGARRTGVLRRFPGMDTRLGWARQLPGVEKGTFEELAKMSGLDAFRPFYTQASHEVHPYPRGSFANLVGGPDDGKLLTGRTNVGLSDAGPQGLIWLLHVTDALLLVPAFHGVKQWLGVEALGILTREAGDAFHAIEQDLVDTPGPPQDRKPPA